MARKRGAQLLSSWPDPPGVMTSSKSSWKNIAPGTPATARAEVHGLNPRPINCSATTSSIVPFRRRSRVLPIRDKAGLALLNLNSPSPNELTVSKASPALRYILPKSPLRMPFRKAWDGPINGPINREKA